MDESRTSAEMSARLASIRAKLARMREESNASLARLAETLADADDRASVRAGHAPPDTEPPAAP
jgi:hypothetical protein